MNFITWIKKVITNFIPNCWIILQVKISSIFPSLSCCDSKRFCKLLSAHCPDMKVAGLPQHKLVPRGGQRGCAHRRAREHLFASLSLPAPRALILVSRPWIMQRPLLAWFSAWALFIYERARSHPHLQSADDFVWIIECPCPAQTAFSCSAAQRKAESATQSL